MMTPGQGCLSPRIPPTSLSMQRPWFYFIAWTSSRVYFTLWNRLSIEGARKLPKTGPVLLCASHASNVDPPLVAICFTHRMLRFMAKAELFRVPLLGTGISWLGAFPVERGGADRKAYVESLKILKEGGALLVFPEGTRTYDGELGEFQDGAARMACAVPGTVILPVRIRGTYESWGRGKKFPSPHKVRVTIGEPFNPESINGLPGDKRAWYQAVTEEMRRRILAL